jgi:hypothetical protein
MKLSLSLALLGAASFCSVNNVSSFTTTSLATRQNMEVSMSTMAESGVPPPTSDASDTEDVEIPTNLPSDCGMDYIPLATMLATGQLAEADQVGNYSFKTFFGTQSVLTFFPMLLHHIVYSRRPNCHLWSKGQNARFRLFY